MKPVSCVRNLGIFIDSDLVISTQEKPHTVALFHRSSSAVRYSTFCSCVNISATSCHLGPLPAGLIGLSTYLVRGLYHLHGRIWEKFTFCNNYLCADLGWNFKQWTCSICHFGLHRFSIFPITHTCQIWACWNFWIKNWLVATVSLLVFIWHNFCFVASIVFRLSYISLFFVLHIWLYVYRSTSN
jgi:hypothetical protein